MPRALIGLGSNLGDRRAALEAATAHLGGLPQTALAARSTWYETAPVGGPLGQQPFLNGCVLLETRLAPEPLLDELQRIETALGRVRETPWGPRTADLDLLLYDEQVVDTPRLRVPHPRLSYRKFVLQGANEIAAAMRHPRLDRTLGELTAHLDRAPRYAVLCGMPSGFRAQFAGEAAHAGGARLVEATAAGVPASAEGLISHGLTAAAAIEFLDARSEAVARSLEEAGDRWVLDDAWPAAEAALLLAALPASQREPLRAAIKRSLRPELVPRLVVVLGSSAATDYLRQTGPELRPLPPAVAADPSDREAALTEIAAALDAAY